MEFIAYWTLRQPLLTGAQLCPVGGTGEGPLDTAAARIQWTVASRERNLMLKVGPAPAGDGGLAAALRLYHNRRQAIESGLPPRGVVIEQTGFRLESREERLTPQAVGEACEIAAPALIVLLGSQGVQVEIGYDAVEAYLFQPLLPERFERAVPVACELLEELLRDAPADLPRWPDLVERADGGRSLVVAPDLTDVDRRAAHRLMQFLAERRGGRGVREASRLIGPVPEPEPVMEATHAPEPMAPAPELEGTSAAEPAAEPFGPLGISPPRPGARPLDEALEPGTGCSEPVGFLCSGPGDSQRDEGLWLLFRIDDEAGSQGLSVSLSAWFLPPVGEDSAPIPVPGLQGVEVPPRVVSRTAYPLPVLEESAYEAGRTQHYVASVDPQGELYPGDGWEGDDPYEFVNRFQRRVLIQLALRRGGETIGLRSAEVLVFDVQRLGSLTLRLLSRLVEVDTQRQAEAQGVHRLYQAYHPWYPVLAIELECARSSLRAIQEDLALQQKNLPAPEWLLQVLFDLELMTFLGVAEALREDLPGLLSPAERQAYETSAAFARLRPRVGAAPWRDAWALHEMVPRSTRLTAAGPVDLRNLLRKRDATLAFLRARRRSLQGALELAGPAPAGGAETLRRLLRDAERAILATTASSFPELRHLSSRMREFVLWHRAGDFDGPARFVPKWLTGAFGDQDGIYPAAAAAYRGNLDELARWARGEGLITFEGDECLPEEVSLIAAMNEGDEGRYRRLQSFDGFGLAPGAALARASDRPELQRAVNVLRSVVVFGPLLDSELWELAARMRSRQFAPGETVISQGDEGSSLFVIESGRVEVAVRQRDGVELPVATLEAGAVFGELALLTGEARTATVRASEQVSLYEVEREDLLPIVQRRSEVILGMSLLLAARQAELKDRSERYLFSYEGKQHGAGRLARAMRGLFLG